MPVNPLIVIPVKDFGEAKSRLAGVLPAGRRAALARRLCERTLRFCRRRLPDHDLLVVTASTAIAALARRHGARVLEEPRAAGLCAAARRAAAWSRRHGYTAQLLIPADIARLDEGEIRHLLAARPAGAGVVICPASDGGTNALLTSPPDALPFRFGERSSEAHRESARRLGLPCRVIELEHLRFDLDTPDDLGALDALIQRQGGDTPQELTRLWNLCSNRPAMTPEAAWLTMP
ncbi:2-phospho-L-lactate guanylyltransferase [Halomonas sp. THAF12]|uniref:2-phospho-L-lactate guanylyltransferase n=1 Tax=Halomonas sp. B23F22_10 TaxID=3459515 RepID=UPI00373F9865